MYKWQNKEIDINQINSIWKIPEFKVINGKVHRLLKFHESWYEDQYLNEIEYFYIFLLSKTFRVLNAEKKLIPYKMANHQIEFHRYDNACLDLQKLPAITRVVIKSRNTSFTVTSGISTGVSAAEYEKNILPVVRLTFPKAVDLIRERKELYINVTPVNVNGRLWPFDPTQIDVSKETEIKFPNKSIIRAFPANNQSSENIRGIRNNASNDLDETNFMSRFQSLFAASKASNAGIADKGYSTFQINIGTTLTGKDTDFAIWLNEIETVIEELEKKDLDSVKQLGLKIFKWPIFDPNIFDIEKPISKQKNLICLVPWQNMEELEKERLKGKNFFLQEYMGQQVDKTGAFYPDSLIESRMENELKNLSSPPKSTNPFYMGVDPAGGVGSDYSAISIFEEVPEKETEITYKENGEMIEREINTLHYYQRHIYLDKYISLPELEKRTRKLLQEWPISVCRVDANGPGTQLGQTLSKEFPSRVELLDSRNKINFEQRSVKGEKIKLSVPLKEYIHTQQYYLMVKGRIHLIKDDLQKIHYSVWDGKFQATHSSKFGHGDSVISNGLAITVDKMVVRNYTPLALSGTLKNAPPNISINHDIDENSVVSGFHFGGLKKIK